jgi:Icc-related predicted phosphoesterase
MDDCTRIWFITDIHGSDVCFRKFLNSVRTAKRPDAIIIGGDITGKYIVPIISQTGNGFAVHFEGKSETLDEEELPEFERRLADKGAYAFRCDQDVARRLTFDERYLTEVTRNLQVDRLKSWVKLADEKMKDTQCKIFINAGNDDPFYVDEILDASKTIVRPEGKAVDIDPYLQMISCGYSRPTPWKCPRDLTDPDEKDFRERIQLMLGQVRSFERCIFNMHCPPYDTALDLAPRLDKCLRPVMGPLGLELTHVGSTAVREAIEKLQPPLGLHGHVHEQHCQVAIGKTICFNPGSEYAAGTLRGVYAVFSHGKLKGAELTREEIGGSDREVSTRGLGGLIKAIPVVGYALHEMFFRKREEDKLDERLNAVENKLDRLLDEGSKHKD